MKEVEFQKTVEQLAQSLGWKFYHAPYEVGPRVRGFPDLVLVRDRILFRELKSARGRLTIEQKAWLEALRKVGADVDVWRPSDLKKIKKELQDPIQREHELDERERELDERERGLEESVSRLEKNVSRLLKAWDERERELNEREHELKEWASRLEEREYELGI